MEIEKKYLIDKIPANLDLSKGSEIDQGYLTLPDEPQTIRLRKKAEKYYKTWKNRGLLARHEREEEIEKQKFDVEWTLVVGNKIKKTRYEIPFNKFLIELDIYHGHLAGLITAEVEFASVEDSESFEPPEWFGRDVTLNSEFKNSNLAFNGIPKTL